MVTSTTLYNRARGIAKRAFYFGTKYRCELCGSRTRLRHTYSFDFPVLRERDVIGAEYVPNDDCPICYANRRSRLVFLYLQSLNIPEGFRVLHVAPELVLYQQFFRKLPIHYQALDLEPERYPYVSGVMRGDVTALPFPAGSFDLVVCNHVLEHVPDDRMAMRELKRVLAPEGSAILQVPVTSKVPDTDEDPSVTDPSERERRFGQYDHVRIYSRDNYFQRLVEAGFVVKVLEPSEFVSPDQLRHYEINPRERLFIAG
jgi:SAM-dependent methyltransferase